ncbi:MAG: hypothetical protein ACFE9S_07190 [Candidatus Hermodarchaeota archaeon]
MFFSELKIFYPKVIIILLVAHLPLIVSLFHELLNVQAINARFVQQPPLDYDDEIELEFGIPTLISEVSVPPGNIFGGQIIEALYLRANFSNNNGSIWINNQYNDTIWQEYFNETIETTIQINSSSIRKYTLWANSSTIGNITIYFTFFSRTFVAENFGLGILLVLLPIIIIGAIIYGIVSRGKKEPHSVRVARRITERLALKYEEKFKKGKFFCPKCGTQVQNHVDLYCKECGYKLREN